MQAAGKVWYWLIEHWPDLVLALAFGVIIDLLRIGSLVRSAARHIKNKLAEQSVAHLDSRITEQEKYRDTVQRYIASDKMLYLATLRSITGVLMFMCMAAVVIILGRLGLLAFPGDDLIAIGIIAVAIGAGVSTMQLTAVHDSSKGSELVRKLNAEILTLKEARTKRQQSHNVVN